MMPEFRPLMSGEPPAAEEEEVIPAPSVAVVEDNERHGEFIVQPLPQGFGMTLGNPLRRVLYSSLPGSAVTWVKIEGVLHEYSTIPHVKEEVSEFLLNIKGIRLRSEVDRPGKLRLEVAGQGEVSGSDIMASSDFEVVNPELHLATLDSEEAKLSVELNVERGTGYSAASQNNGLPIGVLPVDTIYTPVRKVNYKIENMRVGQRTDFERLTVGIWTDGTTSPLDAFRAASKVLVEQFFLFANTTVAVEEGSEGTPIALQISPEQFNTPVERLDLSSRTLNCLKRAGIDKVGEVLGMKKTSLLEIRNFGNKSMDELYNRLRELDLLPPELDPNFQEETTSEAGGQIAEDQDSQDTEQSVEAISETSED